MADTETLTALSLYAQAQLNAAAGLQLQAAHLDQRMDAYPAEDGLAARRDEAMAGASHAWAQAHAALGYAEVAAEAVMRPPEAAEIVATRSPFLNSAE
jgi:hypothetical protein